jgi:PIN domain nuclease of toxin-antitoxin system
VTLACVLDASAVLALLQAEPCSDAVLSRIEQGACCISAVNVTEVLTRLIDRGMSGHDAEAAFDALELAVWAFDDAAARACAALRPASRTFGLSIGDRACLALARVRHVPVLTADRAWAGLAEAIGVEVELVR